MNLGIMQPYFFPYIGYWQLMKLTDQYLIYDDVNYIKGGWINRNRILSNGNAVYINAPTRNASPNKRICQIETDISDFFLEKTRRKLIGAYKKAPYFEEVFPYLMDIIDHPAKNLSEYLQTLIISTARLLGISTEFRISSRLNIRPDLHGEDRILEICKALGADTYYNAIGGKELYSYEHFRSHGLTLKFVEAGDIRYTQFHNAFIPNLSIIDVLMFNGLEQTRKYLEIVNIHEETYFRP